ncbi:SDR family oxidoreductase [Sporosarcina contaminans]|uniref:SDR family oxidoreductase n=1 Tax=Sporosarcina contaminans TaxID=633403 RepID=A0ABW3TZD8_9BACL
MAKHGVVGLTKVAGIEYAAKGIRVNAIAPCLVETPITKGWMIQSSVRQLLVIFQWIALRNLRKLRKW